MPTTARRQTVESFSLCLEDFNQALQAEQSISHIETHLLAALANPVRLLRWAIVKVEEGADGTRFWCEGAYLKTCQ